MVLIISATVTTRTRTGLLGATANSPVLVGTIFGSTRGLRWLLSKTSRIEVVIGFRRLRSDGWCGSRTGLKSWWRFSDCGGRRCGGRFWADFRRKLARNCFRGLCLGLLNGSRHKLISLNLKLKYLYSGGDRKRSSRGWLLPRCTSLDDSDENQFNLELINNRERVQR